VQVAWRALCEDTPCGVILMDAAHHILEANASACRAFSRSLDQLRGRRVLEHYPPDLHAEWNAWTTSIQDPNATESNSSILQFILDGRHWSASGRLTRLVDGRAAILCTMCIVVEPTPLRVMLNLLHKVSDRRASLGELAHLSDRELEVAMLIASGYSDSDIASTICRSLRTVHAHRRMLGRKMGVERRHEISRQMCARGLIAQ
jgi:PAS domain S-box-containing protein